MNTCTPKLATEKAVFLPALECLSFAGASQEKPMKIQKPINCKSCLSTDSVLRRRVIAGGAIQIVHQCLNCGRSAGNPISHSSIARPQDLPAWDDRIAKDYDQRRADDRLTNREEWFKSHDEYLRSPKWRALRSRVIARCKGICEGCGDANVDHVHHLTYDHWQDELLFELVGLCEPCHEKAHKPVTVVGVAQYGAGVN